MAITTKGIIKILPFSEEFKTSLFEQFDSLDPDQKFEITEVLWDTYNALYRLKLEENIDLAIQSIADRTGIQLPLDANFYKKIEEQTEKDMQQQVSEVESTEGIVDARQRLEAIIKEQQ